MPGRQRQHDSTITDDDFRRALQQFDALWDKLFPAEQARIIQLLVERVDLSTEGATIRIRSEGLSGLAKALPLNSSKRLAA